MDSLEVWEQTSKPHFLIAGSDIFPCFVVKAGGVNSKVLEV